MRRMIIAAPVLVGLTVLLCFFRPGPARLLWEATGKVTDMALSPDGKTLAVVDSNGLSLVDPGSGKVRRVTQGEAFASFTKLSWDPSGRYVLWNEVREPEKMAVFDVQADHVVAHIPATLAPTRGTLPAGTPILVKQGNSLKVLDTATWSTGRTVTDAPCQVQYLNVSEDRLVCTGDRLVTYQFSTGKPIESYQYELQSESVSPDGRLTLASPGKGDVRKTEVIDLRDGSRRSLVNSVLNESAWLGEDTAALSVLDAGQPTVVVDVKTGEVRDTGIKGIVEENQQQMHWSAEQGSLWVFSQHVYANAWATTTRNYLHRYNPQFGKLRQWRLPGEPSVARWDDAHEIGYVVIDEHKVYRFMTK